MAIATAATTPRHSRRLALVLGGLIALTALLAAVAYRFIGPAAEPDSIPYAAGRVAAFPPGTVTTVQADGVRDRAPGTWHTPVSLSRAHAQFHIVRFADGSFLALSARDPRNGCAVRWLPTRSFEGTEGILSEGCHGSSYDVTGRRVFGPSPGDLTHYPIRIEGEFVIVDIGRPQHGRSNVERSAGQSHVAGASQRPVSPLDVPPPGVPGLATPAFRESGPEWREVLAGIAEKALESAPATDEPVAEEAAPPRRRAGQGPR